MIKPTVAAVIPVKNGYPEIKDCIEGLLRQSMPLNRILVLDSGSTDGTLEYLRSIPLVKIIDIDPSAFNHGETRNLGWRQATEEYLLYTVQDAKPVNEYLIEDLLKGFTDDNVAGVCGQQVVPHDIDKNPVEWFRPIDMPEIVRYQFVNANDFHSISADRKKQVCSWDDVVAIYRRSALIELPFQRITFGEDMLWAREALVSGLAIVYNPAARVYHYHSETSDFTFRRALTTLYFRYRHFGYIPPMPFLGLRKRIDFLRLIVKARGVKPRTLMQWYSYNVNRFRSYRRAYLEFVSAAKAGDDVLDKVHEKYCGKPPTPVKTV